MALLRGKLSLEHNFVIYSGKWGFNKEAFAEKDTGKFEFKSTSPAELPESKDVDILFDGYFVMKKDEKKVKIKEDNVKLFFKKGETSNIAVTGTGKNKFGDFSLDGNYDPSGHKMQLEKAYIEEDGEFSSGDDSGSSDDEGSGVDEDEDVADELADLKADQEEHGLVLQPEEQDVEEKGSRLKKKGKRIIRKTSETENRHGKNTIGAAADDDDDDDDEMPAKRTKKETESSSSTTPKGIESLPIPETSWETSALAEKQERLRKMVDMNDSLGIGMMLTDLSAHKISVTQLQETGIGKEVRGLKKHSSTEVNQKAEALVALWKDIIKQETK